MSILGSFGVGSFWHAQPEGFQFVGVELEVMGHSSSRGTQVCRSCLTSVMTAVVPTATPFHSKALYTCIIFLVVVCMCVYVFMYVCTYVCGYVYTVSLGRAGMDAWMHT